MKICLNRQVASRTAIAAGVLVLLASVVSGREKPDASEIALPVEAVATRGSGAEPAVELDLDSLKRPKRDATVVNLFAPVKQPAPPSAPPLQAGRKPEPAKPAAPPLPFKYLAQVLEDGKQSVFLVRDNRHYSVQAGQTIDNEYRVEKIAKNEVTMTYLPAGVRQTLAIPAIE
ncbi:MAG: hypothetical protein A3G27_03265 [Betaproteobacteria bacterium RIFCSPLOWO2_12_FULL_66_14]|nr:MAG: hypothetical protein A3G27_03265 [Betaproteobacteria bacterium RIFCSPLOWO2_12_FULL_66_14]